MENYTDNDIIKALECCVRVKEGCEGCPYEVVGCLLKNGTNKLLEDALDLIKRQKAENERLQKEIEEVNEADREEELQAAAENKETAKLFCEAINHAKSEAIKEFQKKSKCRSIKLYKKYHHIANSPLDKIDMFYQGRAEAIWECINLNDNLVKEMTEVSDNGNL